MTMRPVPSTISVSAALPPTSIDGRTSRMRLPSISTSPMSKSPIVSSMLMIVADLISVRRIASSHRFAGDRRLTGPGARDQVADGVAFERARVPIGVGDREIRGLVDAAFGHADVAQCDLRTQPLRQLEKPLRCIGGADGAGDPRHRVGPGRRVVARRVRQHDGGGLGMRAVKGGAGGSTMVWVSAGGRSKVPPSVWQSL